MQSVSILILVDIGLVLEFEKVEGHAGVVSILILVDIGLVPLHLYNTNPVIQCLNPYSCGYRTGTAMYDKIVI